MYQLEFVSLKFCTFRVKKFWDTQQKIQIFPEYPTIGEFFRFDKKNSKNETKLSFIKLFLDNYIHKTNLTGFVCRLGILSDFFDVMWNLMSYTKFFYV